MEIDFGFCHCGCGNKTPICSQTSSKHGRRKGQPQRFIKNHDKRLSGVDYLIEDRGYKTPCWIWQRALDKDGYGVDWNGKLRRAHAVYYERVHGPLPAFEPPFYPQLDHLCRVHPCVNPEHLELVVAAVNTWRGKTSKLTPSIVRDIRALAGTDTQRNLARHFGVGEMCISCVIRRVTWKTV